MPPVSIETFLKSLHKSRLLSDAQIGTLKQQLQGNPLTAKALAEVLVNQNHLTPWQAKQLLRGETGFVLKQYRLLAPVGKGGMGHVFKGRDTGSGATVAVKVMARKLTSNQALVSRFQREIRANAKLNSPHIVKSLDAGRVGKVDFMVMEFVNGDQVDRIASVLGRVPIELACEIVRQAAIGLEHAHEHGMVHRDIKPGNLMVNWNDDGEGVVKLMDMGLVLLTSEDSNENTVTRAGQVMGTPDFMSPEQGWDTTKVDVRSDIYSLGCTLYRLLTGTVPFSGTNPLQVLSQRLQRDAPSVLTICDDIPEQVAAIVSRMTLRDPAARYQRPAEVAQALAEVSSRLTRSAMKEAARVAMNDPNANADFGQGSDNEVDENDGTYRQFLKEVQDGTAVNMVMATDASAVPAVETVPLVDINVTTGVPRSLDRRSSRRGQKFGFVVMGLSALVLIAAIAAVVAMNGSGDEEEPEAVDSPPPQEILRPAIRWAEDQPEPDPAVTGRLWKYQPEFAVEPKEQPVSFRLSATAPPDMRVTDDGLISWQVPDSQLPAEYQIGLTVWHENKGAEAQVGETTVTLNVSLGFSMIELPQMRGVSLIPPLQPSRFSMAVTSEYASFFELGYRLDDPVPQGLQIDSITGELSWQPTLQQLGRHELNISVFDRNDPSLVSSQTVRVMVRPTSIAHVFPQLPRQTAEAGRAFVLRLPLIPTRRPGRTSPLIVFELAPGAPDDVILDSETNTIRWRVPEDQTGPVDIPVKASIQLRDNPGLFPLDDLAVVRVDVRPASSPPGNRLSLPDENAMTAALTELKKTFGRPIAQARSVLARAELACRLLEQCEVAEPGATDAALLQLIEEELAVRARATDVLLQIALLRRDRYGVEPETLVRESVAAARRTALSPRQLDMTIERALTWSLVFAGEQDFETTADLLKLVDTLSGRATRGPAKDLASDVESAMVLARELASASGRPDELKSSELLRLLRKWQFVPLLRNNAAISFIQFSPEGSPPVLDDNGQSLWTVSPQSVSLAADTLPVSVGLVDNSREVSRVVLRFEMGPDTRGAHLMFGITGEDVDDFQTYRMVLDRSGAGRIQSLKPAAGISEPVDVADWKTDQSNLVELVIDAGAVVGRVNGKVVAQATVPGLQTGKLGILADLRITGPSVDIRNARVLELTP
ncbi:MAG: protein kinase [Planctomycetaceae bacterium]|nr:protein kinase [Planctomycetaceae bacterium]